MARIKIFIDTSADMPEQLAKEKGIGILRFMSVFGDESFVTGEEINNEQFYERLASFDGIPKTSQTPYGVIYDALMEASQENDTVIYFTISSKASGQYNTAKMVADEIKEENPDADIRIVDSKRFSAYISMAALLAVQLVESGRSADDIIAECEKEMQSWEAYMLVDTLKYLEKGGRITKTSAIVGTLLDIKPVLSIKNGLIEPVEKLRGKKKIFKKLMMLIRENPEFDDKNPQMMIVHSSREYAEEATAAMREEFGIEPSMVYEFGPVVGTHIGPGTLAVLFKLEKQG